MAAVVRPSDFATSERQIPTASQGVTLCEFQPRLANHRLRVIVVAAGSARKEHAIGAPAQASNTFVTDEAGDGS
jgi:hypothetical protein